MSTSLSRRDHPLRYLARITLQASTPFHVGSGREWRESDAGVATDANGLPTIPGTSVAGVLRHAMEANANHAEVKSLFGFQDRSASGQGSRLVVSFACIHDSHDIPVVGLLSKSQRNEDRVLANALRPTLRDHARHNSQGVVDHAGKFDDLVVCAGHRFTLEIELIGHAGDASAWADLLNLFFASNIRFGGKTTRGLGRFEPISIVVRTFDLTSEADFHAYAAHPSRLDCPVGAGWQVVAPPAVHQSEITLRLTPRGFWLFGGGLDADTDIVPVQDRVIEWSGSGVPREATRFSLPGSSLKGALRHRALYHAYEKYGYFSGDSEESPAKKEAEALVAGLFGNAPAAGEDSRLRGALLFSDLTATAELSPLQHHVSIDRFTGGARDTALFDETPLYGGEELVWPIGLARDLTEEETQFLRILLADLTESRLPLGGGSGRGHGYFSGTVHFPSDLI